MTRPPAASGNIPLIQAGVYLAPAAAAARNPRAPEEGMIIRVQPSNQDLGGVVRVAGVAMLIAHLLPLATGSRTSAYRPRVLTCAVG